MCVEACRNHSATHKTWHKTVSPARHDCPLGHIVLLCGAVLRTEGCLAAALASAHCRMAELTPPLQLTPPPITTSKTASRHCQMSSLGQDCPQLRTAA